MYGKFKCFAVAMTLVFAMVLTSHADAGGLLSRLKQRRSCCQAPTTACQPIRSCQPVQTCQSTCSPVATSPVRYSGCGCCPSLNPTATTRICTGTWERHPHLPLVCSAKLAREMNCCVTMHADNSMLLQACQRNAVARYNYCRGVPHRPTGTPTACTNCECSSPTFGCPGEPGSGEHQSCRYDCEYECSPPNDL
ncbi:hypothetical protein K239x_04240 [Planctomycetes bacterium K23_9]|uniref:Uncharacterized protein n=1 Tax=Stieleria marina TaxID=1930275 RepID=A0A517NMX8_9BACT|nr:hypothetical protein K239x_04240 [Planctomycetes bacterium K23_9]